LKHPDSELEAFQEEKAMSDAIPESWQIFIEQYPQFIKLQRKLAKMDWYIRDEWVMFVGHYFAGIFTQIYKSNWLNSS
jgi:hypothetical protein